MGTRDAILVILGSSNRHFRTQRLRRSSFIDFRVDLGSLLGPTLDTFFCFSVIWGAKVGDGFQVHVFGDPGMEMMPECNGVCAINIVKTVVSE